METSRGCKRVSNYQRLVIKAVIECGSRSLASEHLGVNRRTIDDVLYRGFKALKVNNITDAYYLVNNGIFSREGDAGEDRTG